MNPPLNDDIDLLRLREDPRLEDTDLLRLRLQPQDPEGDRPRELCLVGERPLMSL